MRDKLGIVVAVAVALAALSQLAFVQRLEADLGLAWLYGVRGTVEPPDGAAVIAIDEESAEWLRRNSARLASTAPGLKLCLGEGAAERLGSMRTVSEIPRDVFACLVERLLAEQPRLLVFDIHFAVSQPRDPHFAEAIAGSGRVLLLERVHVQERPGEDSAPLVLRRGPVADLREAALGTIAFLVESAAGHVTTGYRTRVAEFPDLRIMPVEAHRLVGGAVPQLNGHELFWLYGPSRTVPTHSLREVFDPMFRRPLDVRDRVIFIGGADFGPGGARDSFPVPAFGQALSGVELAATAYLNLREGRRLVTPEATARAALAGAVAALLAATALFVQRRFATGAVLLAAGLVAGVAAFLFHQGVWLPVTVPLLAGLPLSALIGLERRLSLARRVTSALLPRTLSEEMLESGQADPKTEPASVMFVDIVGSTGLAERHGPEVLTPLLSRYYRTVSDAVDRHGGAVYTYQGDGALALFSGGREHAANACAAARRIAETLPAALATDGLPAIRLRIGIATGPVAFGMLRFGKHFSVSTMGDAVNRAFRLQEMGREVMQETGAAAVVTLIDEATAAHVEPDRTRVRFRTNAMLRGRSSPTGVYHLTT